MYSNCLHCANILACPMLSDAKGTFVLERVIREKDQRECDDFQLINSMQNEVRKGLVVVQGEDSTLRILHKVGTIIKEDEEGSNEMMEDMPDFAGMLVEGMMSADREEQLRYETDEHGNVIPEDLGNGETMKRPRPTYQLRKFACDPEGYIQLDQSAGMFQTQDWLIKHILKIEIDNGLINRSKRTKTMAPKLEAEPQEKENMAAGRKVLTRRGAKAGAEKGPKPPVKTEAKGPKAGGVGGAKVGKPPKRSVAPQSGGKAPTSLPDAPVFDTEALMGEIQIKVGETVSRIVEEKSAELSEQIAEAFSKLMDGITIFHDFMCQTAGTMQYEEGGESVAIEEMFDNEDKILGHLGGGGGDEDEDEGEEDPQ